MNRNTGDFRARTSISSNELHLRERAKKIIADEDAPLVKDYFSIDEARLILWSQSSSFWSRSKQFYRQVKNRRKSTLSEAQLDWLEDIAVKLKDDTLGPGKVKIWTKEEIAARNQKPV